MELFERMAQEGHEQVMFFRDRRKKLKAIIAFHDTTLGPALGGTRMFMYPSEEDAIIDALRLSRGMTQKSCASGNYFGGGKAVIWGDPANEKDELLFRAFGRFIQGLKGRFITGTDVGTFPEDFAYCLSETNYVVGLPVEYGGSGDTSILTAYGVFLGIIACAEEAFHSPSLKGLSVAIQGVGKVGGKLARRLSEQGCRLILSDLREDYAKKLADELGAQFVSSEEILFQDVDILAPCAMGGILNQNTIKDLKCKVVSGAANNQLEKKEDARALFERGILYAPDYIINAGGAIQVADELYGYNAERAKRKVENIPVLLKEVFRISREENLDTETSADLMVERRINGTLELKGTYVPRG